MKSSLKNRGDKRAYVYIFLEILLTNKFRHYPRKNAISIEHKLIFIHSLLIHLILVTLIFT